VTVWSNAKAGAGGTARRSKRWACSNTPPRPQHRRALIVLVNSRLPTCSYPSFASMGRKRPRHLVANSHPAESGGGSEVGSQLPKLVTYLQPGSTVASTPKADSALPHAKGK
jgi:hypothetical protein